MHDLTSEYDARVYDPITREWRAVTVPAEAPPKPRGRRRTHRHGAPRDLSGLSTASPFAETWEDTAFAPAAGPAGFAPRRDMSRFIPPAHMRTHRAAIPGPGFDPGNVTARRPRT